MKYDPAVLLTGFMRFSLKASLLAEVRSSLLALIGSIDEQDRSVFWGFKYAAVCLNMLYFILRSPLSHIHPAVLLGILTQI